ncbi:MAG: nucleotidyltransferase domain-containing protein [Hormoscilla sp. GUM202]|nr:nucleotidyltransferase domain-containing protein [Hormoscilla sp. GUM202]
MLTEVDPEIPKRLGIDINYFSTFCQRWGITYMALFGSVLRSDFRADSDIDFLITFAPNVRQGLLTLAKIKHELEFILNRPVDLALKYSIEASDNWIRRREILSTAKTIYKQGYSGFYPGEVHQRSP